MSLKFAANLSFLYQDIPFLDRFDAAAADGFKGVEYLFPYDFEPAELKKRLDDNGLIQALFNLSAGDFDKGDRGLASLTGREAEFQASLDQAIEYANVLGCTRLHVMAGLRDTTIAEETQLAVYRNNLRKAAAACAESGITALIEPINIQDMPGYFLDSASMAAALIEDIDHPNLRLQFDIYHVQRTDGDIVRQYKKFAPLIRHIQIANPPNRYEPDNGEVNYPYIFDLLEAEGYDGWIGCEYKPSSGTRETLGWAEKFLPRA
ncbi:2-oxo-tetronate isomerase [Sneathiella sp.]|uniref:2-oxo-tetronate isomerase n=1 Tax=Sneathiella sp. TaxID=1964365 RepID=UPI002602F315|nr:2-oxo-tetronate isomerase [Sneathiella sp.]MDF2367522.1 hydroxypyruvate isomerase family protein [Sneathiella sp.]